MSDAQPQTYANHQRLVPGFHFVTAGLLVIGTLWAIYRAITNFSIDQLMVVVLSVAVILLFLYSRTFATVNQDRIIRLEERLRLAQLLPLELQQKANELSLAQLIGLRFASDQELPALARRVIDENITDREAIKKMVVTWRADHLRV